jgi:hypothetical protein
MSMAKHTSDPIARALSELDSGTRALLDLSLRRALDDDELAKLVSADPARIAERRERTLDEMATAAGIEGPGAREQVTERLLAVPSEVWLASSAPDEPQAEPPPAPAPPTPEPPPPPVAPKSAPAVARPPIKDARSTVGTQVASVGPPPGPGSAPPVAVASSADDPVPGTRSRNRVMVIVALALAAVLLAVLLLGAADDSDEAAPATTPPPTDGPAQTTPTDGPPPDEEPKLAGAPLEPLPGAGRGSVEVRLEVGGTIVAGLDGLPAPGRDVYKLWLYNSILDSKGLGTTGSASGSIEARLPANADRYRFLDLTMQPRKRTSPHNGRSLFRAPLSQIQTA